MLMSVVDLPGMGNQNTREVRKRVAAMTGLGEAQVLIDQRIFVFQLELIQITPN